MKKRRNFVISCLLMFLMISCVSMQTEMPKESNILSVDMTMVKKRFENYGFSFVEGESSSPSVDRIVGDSPDGTSFLQLDSVDGKIIEGSIWISFTNDYESDVQNLFYIMEFIDQLLPAWKTSEEWVDSAINEISASVDQGRVNHEVSTTVNDVYVELAFMKEANIMVAIISNK